MADAPKRNSTAPGKGESQSTESPPLLSAQVPVKDKVSHGKRASSPSHDTPPSKVSKSVFPPTSDNRPSRDGTSGEQPKSTSPVCKADFITMFNAAFSAVLPPSLLQTIKKNLSKPTSTKSSGGSDRSGNRRSVLPSATVTSGAIGSPEAPLLVTTGQGQLDYQFTGAGTGPSVQVLNQPNQTQVAGRTYSLLIQTISSYPPSGQARPGFNQGSQVSSLGTGTLGIEHSASLPATVMIAADSASLPASAVTRLPVTAGNGQMQAGSQ